MPWKISWSTSCGANLKLHNSGPLGCTRRLCFIQSLYHLHALTQNSSFYFFFSPLFFSLFLFIFFLNKSLRFSFSQIYVFLLAFAELLSEVFCAASWHTHRKFSKRRKKKMEIKQEGKNEVRKSRAPVAAGKWKMGCGWAK